MAIYDLLWKSDQRSFLLLVSPCSAFRPFYFFVLGGGELWLLVWVKAYLFSTSNASCSYENIWQYHFFISESRLMQILLYIIVDTRFFVCAVLSFVLGSKTLASFFWILVPWIQISLCCSTLVDVLFKYETPNADHILDFLNDLFFQDWRWRWWECCHRSGCWETCNSHPGMAVEWQFSFL